MAGGDEGLRRFLQDHDSKIFCLVFSDEPAGYDQLRLLARQEDLFEYVQEAERINYKEGKTVDRPYRKIRDQVFRGLKSKPEKYFSLYKEIFARTGGYCAEIWLSDFAGEISRNIGYYLKQTALLKRILKEIPFNWPDLKEIDDRIVLSGITAGEIRKIIQEKMRPVHNG